MGGMRPPAVLHRLAAGFAFLLLPLTAAGEADLVIEDAIAAGEAEFVMVPFEVPAGVAEIEVRHVSIIGQNILDFGLKDPAGWRGWGGGNTEPLVVGEAAASRSYLPGPITPGTWEVVIGQARVGRYPAEYRLEIFFRDEPTLAAQPERAPYVPAAPLHTGARWYAGDLHVHSKESGDAVPPLDEIATFARDRGLDFVAITDHNTVSHLDFITDAQARHPELLLIPGIEVTTYAGHANAFGVRDAIDHRVGLPDWSMADLVEGLRAQGALLSVNHPVLDLGDLCIGCAWDQDVSLQEFAAVEIGTGGLRQGGFLFVEEALAFWDALLDSGLRLAAIGGSDDHRAGVGLAGHQSPIGDPTTLVHAAALSEAAILEAIAAGRTVVKLQGPDDPMVELFAGDAMIGDDVHGPEIEVMVRVEGGAGHALRLVRDGLPGEAIAIDGDPFVYTTAFETPESATIRVRAEVLVDGTPRTVTSHLWLSREAPIPSAVGCGCATSGAPMAGAVLLLLLALAGSRRLRISAARRETA
jgi:MYXO-CTERM domain-containing protein